MRGMKFSLDIIWLKDKQIIEFSKNIPPPMWSGTALPSYYPGGEINAVLEVNAGWCDEHQLRVGDKIILD